MNFRFLPGGKLLVTIEPRDPENSRKEAADNVDFVTTLPPRLEIYLPFRVS